MSTDLIVTESLNPAVIFTTEGGIDGILKGIEERAMAHVPDLTTAKGRKDIASMAHKVAQSKTYLDGEGKKLVEGIKAQAKVIDASRKKCRDFLDDLKVRVRQPLTDFEEAEKERIAKHESNIREISSLSALQFDSGETKTLADLRSDLSVIEAITIDDSWEEFLPEAASVKDKGTTILRNAIMDIEKREAEAAELARLRKEAEDRKAAEEAARVEAERKEREERIAREAAERAKAEAESKAMAEREAAEKAERERIQAAEQARADAERRERELIEKAEQEKKESAEREAKAERDKIAAEERAKIEKEMAVKEAERKAKAEADYKEQVRLAKEKAERDAADKLAANKKHRSKIHGEIKQRLLGLDLDDHNAECILDAIVSGRIPHVTVVY